MCLIYVERLMEKANVPLLATTWRPVILCAMLLASKVWQDCASWNIEFSVVFPQRAAASRRAPPPTRRPQVLARGHQRARAQLRDRRGLGHVHLAIPIREVLLRIALAERAKP